MRMPTITITPPLLLIAAACAAAPRVYTPTCDDWGDQWFFRSASAQLVRACIETGADVNAPGDGGRTPLHWTIFAGPALVRTLLEAGADVNAPDDVGWTPLNLAAHNRGPRGSSRSWWREARTSTRPSTAGTRPSTRPPNGAIWTS